MLSFFCRKLFLDFEENCCFWFIRIFRRRSSSSPGEGSDFIDDAQDLDIDFGAVAVEEERERLFSLLLVGTMESIVSQS